MKRENQVCTLEQGKRLKELGVEQESLFSWCVFCPDPLGEQHHYDIIYEKEVPVMEGEMIAPAFTVAELGELLKEFTNTHRDDQCFPVWYHDSVVGWWCSDYTSNYDTEAWARAAMLIHLIETNQYAPAK